MRITCYVGQWGGRSRSGGRSRRARKLKWKAGTDTQQQDEKERGRGGRRRLKADGNLTESEQAVRLVLRLASIDGASRWQRHYHCRCPRHEHGRVRGGSLTVSARVRPRMSAASASTAGLAMAGGSSATLRLRRSRRGLASSRPSVADKASDGGSDGDDVDLLSEPPAFGFVSRTPSPGRLLGPLPSYSRNLGLAAAFAVHTGRASFERVDTSTPPYQAVSAIAVMALLWVIATSILQRWVPWSTWTVGALALATLFASVYGTTRCVQYRRAR